jgi:hypothetical protein
MTTADLIEALTKLVDEHLQMNPDSPPVTAYLLVQHIGDKYEGITAHPLNAAYQTLMAQAHAMMLRHYGTSVLDYELLGDLFDEMDALKENANE